jgi:hypothetical protein
VKAKTRIAEFHESIKWNTGYFYIFFLLKWLLVSWQLAN